MAAGGHVIANFHNLIKTIEDLKRIESPISMQKIGLKVQELNEQQIEKEIEASGKKTKPYCETYREQKGESKVTYVSRKMKPIRELSKKSQRIIFASIAKNKKKGKKGTKMPWHGHMMDAFGVISVRVGEVIVGFQSIEARQRAAWNYRLRKFIGLTPGNKLKLRKYIKENILRR